MNIRSQILATAAAALVFALSACAPSNVEPGTGDVSVPIPLPDASAPETQAQIEQDKAVAACTVTDAGIELITALGKNKILSAKVLNDAAPYIKTLVDICDGPTPPTYAQVTSDVFVNAAQALSTVPTGGK